MRTALAVALAAAAVAGVTACSGTAPHAAWCRAAEHLNVTSAEPARLQHDIRLMNAALGAASLPALQGYTAAQRGEKAGKDGAVILKQDCGYAG